MSEAPELRPTSSQSIQSGSAVGISATPHLVRETQNSRIPVELVA